MKIRSTTNGIVYDDVDDELAMEWIEKGFAEPVTEREVDAAERAVQPEPEKRGRARKSKQTKE